MNGMGLALNKQNSKIAGFGGVFTSIWETSNTSVGSSNADQIKLPLESGGTYDFFVDWGDGNKDHITAYNQAEVTHTYASSGEYSIKISGQCERFKFADTGDKLKLLSIENGGSKFKLVSGDSCFHGCANLTSVNNLNTSDITTAIRMFYVCSSLVSIGIVDISNVISAYRMFRDCVLFNQDLSNFDTSNLTTMEQMFYNCTNFNQDLSNFDSSNVTNMFAMFELCTNFNQDLSNFDTSKVTRLDRMFQHCTNFNQDLSSFDISSCTAINLFLNNATSFSTENYDLLLISFASQTVNSGLTFDCSSYYTLGGAAESARTSLINDDGWTINDLGGV